MGSTMPTQPDNFQVIGNAVLEGPSISIVRYRVWHAHPILASTEMMSLLIETFGSDHAEQKSISFAEENEEKGHGRKNARCIQTRFYVHLLRWFLLTTFSILAKRIRGRCHFTRLPPSPASPGRPRSRANRIFFAAAATVAVANHNAGSRQARPILLGGRRQRNAFLGGRCGARGGRTGGDGREALMNAEGTTTVRFRLGRSLVVAVDGPTIIITNCGNGNSIGGSGDVVNIRPLPASQFVGGGGTLRDISS